MTLRKIFFWLHLSVGAIAGAVVLVMAVTGFLLTYERQIISWTDSELRSVAPSPGTARLPIDSLVAAAAESTKETPSTVTVRSDPNAAAEIGFGRERVVFVNPYTGVVLGEGSKQVRSFFQTTTELHRWFALSGQNRNIGRAITGACNFGFLFLVLSGIYMWFPRKWTWQHIRPVFLFRGGLSGKPRDFNWHNVIGIWSAVPLFFIVLTGVIMSYPWASDLLYRMTGSEPPAQGRAGGPGGPARGEGRRREGGGEERQAEAPFANLNTAWAAAEHQVAGWQIITLRLPASARGPLTFTIDTGNGGQTEKRGQYTISRRNGEVTRAETFSSYNLGRKLRGLGRFIHTGEEGGLIGQTIAGLASGGGAVLVWTGIALSLRRLQSWRKRKSQKKEVGVEVMA